MTVVAFALIHLIPGNPLDILLPPEAPKTVVDRLRVEFGFDRPLYIQYLVLARAGIARESRDLDLYRARGHP